MRPETMLSTRSVEGQPNSVDRASAQSKSTPILTLQNAPDIPQCHEILNQAILDLVNTASEDPAQTFENNRRAQPHSIMVASPLNCASKLWMAVRRSSRPTEFGEFADSATSLEFLSLRQNPMETVFNPVALNASVATNNNPAGGIEEYQGTSSIAIDPNNPLHLIGSSNSFYRDPASTCQSPTGGTANTYGTLALFGSTDGGATWTYNCAPWPAAITGGVTGATFWFGSYPTLAWDNQGQAYAAYLLISQSASAYGAAIVVARSSDNGASWQSLGTVVNGIASTTQGNDKEMMAIDNTSGQTFSHAGRIYVTWQAANAQKIAFSDNGTAWTTVNFPSNTGAGGGNLVIGADGTVYVIWNRYNVETIVFSKSIDGGVTWTAPAVIATLALQSYGTNNKPPAQDKRGVNGFGAIDVDRNPASAFFGNLYVAFSDFPTGTTTGADLDTYLIRSTNGGASWSSRVKVNDDNFGATQMLPWLAVDQADGTVNVSWYDTRLDPLNRKTQVVYARSTDGGVLFEPNVLVSDGGSAWRNNVNYSDENSADNSAYNSNQFGDYSGLAALNRQAHPIWTDSRMFFPVADTQSPSRKEDTATATITNCSAPSAIASPGVNPSTAPSVAITWSAPAAWGTNATNGTYSIFRDTSPVFPSGSPLASALTSTSYVDTTGNSGTTYYYFVRAKNSCPGTALTPMSTDSPASAAVEFGAAGTPTGILQGTITAGISPLSGVVVTAGTFSATTNASGYYLLTAINASTYSVSASPAGYSPVSVTGVVVSGGGTTVQNLALSPISSGSSCFTDTTYFDLSNGGGSNLDISSTPGDVKLRNLGIEATDQVSSPAALSTTNNLSATTWTGQTYRAGVTGNLTKLTVGLGLASGTSGTITVEIRNLNGINPGTTVLATGTLGPVTNVGTAVLYTTTFASPAALVSGTSYSIVLRTSVGNTVFGVRGSTAGGSSLANGQVFTTTNSGSTWTPVAADLYFTTYVTPPTTFVASGNLISAVKDAQSVVGLVPRWLTLSWTMTNPANTGVQFQAAASNNANGPFDFVGPDGTASTFFTTTGASLSQFNGFRYLKYKALLSTTDNIVTPALNDVIVCFDNNTPLITAAAPLSRQQAGGAVNAQIATVSDPGQAANTLTVSSTPLNGSGVSIDNINIDSAGTVTADVTASCTATNSIFTLTVTNSGCATATATLTVNVTAIDTPAITPGGPTTVCEGGSVTLTSSSASGNQWYLNGNPIGGATNQQYTATASGNYTNVVTASGCPSAPSAATTVTVNPTPATPTITPGGPTTFCQGGSVTLTSSSASGNQWYLNGNPVGGATNQQYTATASGNYTNVVTASACPSAPSAATTVTVNPTPATPTITPGGPTTFCQGGSVTLTSSSASGNQWYLNGNPVGGATNQQYSATASGNYTNVVTASGCASAPSAATTVTVNPTPATPTITPGGPTTFCQGGSVTLTSSSASGNQWSLNGNPIGGETNQNYIANASGNYTVTVTDGNSCTSAQSAPT
ncbi:MAG TPA: carboxypeptidase regulatory-like domain-containing protein, partial [Pyrinomonadaceae bacterium]|nr:carboxypeptidase regulatory-like domain-containing protein [Pyrinomonadaceae bacterium]